MASTTKSRTKKTETAEPEEEVQAETPEAPKEEPGVFCYIGPSIHGTIQSNTIYEGTLSEIKASLATAIEKHPGIAGLIVRADETLAASRREVKTNGTLLHKRFVDLAAGKN